MNPGPPVSRLRRRLLIAGGVIAAFTVIGFFVLPPIVKHQLERRASEALGRKVTVGRVQVNPYALSLTLEDLNVRRKEGEGSFLGWRRFYVNFDPLSSLREGWTFGAIELEGLQVAATLQRDGTFSFADIIERLKSAAPSAPPAKPPAKPGKAARPVHIGLLKVQGARLEFVDETRSRPFATTIGPLDFQLTEFFTVGERGAPYRFAAVTEAGEKFAWTGTLSAEPLASTGELRLEDIPLAKYAPYYADLLLADLTSGKLSVSGRYEARFERELRVLKLTGGAAQLRELTLVERASREPVLELPALDISGVNADAVARQARLDSVVLQGGHVRIRRESDGSINLLNLLAPAKPSATAAPPAAKPAPLPDFNIGEVAVKNFQVDVTDRAAPRPVQLGLSGLQFSLKNVTLADGAEMPVQLALNWAPQGEVKVEGTVAIMPELKSALQVEVAALALLPLSPYLEQFINAHLTQGTVTTAGTVRVAMADGAPTIGFEGGVTLEKLGLVDGARNEELAGFASLALSGLKASTAPQLAIALAEVKVASPYARVILNQDGTLNVATLAKSPAPAGPGGGAAVPPGTSTPATSPAPWPKIEIAKVVISDGDFSVADRSIEPNVRMAVTQFGGTIAGLSSAALARADVDLKAAVNGAGPVAITGKLDPLGAKKFVDLKVDFKNVDLLPLSAYSGKFAGYQLARGKLNLDVKARLDDRKLDSTNVITLEQFTFGAPVESRDATKLPVRLGVALLKDMDGRIVIDVPMAGSLDDPELRIGKVVVRVIVNLLTKAAVSPFALIGSMFGGGGEELAFQEFAPGRSELQDAEKGKLATMVKALTNRPGLSLALEGGCDGPADTHVLKRLKLAALVRSRIWEERRVADPNVPPPDKIEIAPADYVAQVKKLFDEKFPPGTEFGAPLPPPPPVVAPPPPPKKGIFRRIVDTVTFRHKAPELAKPVELVPATAAPADATATGPAPEEMAGRLAESMEVTDNDLSSLAEARAQRVRDYFRNEGNIAAERLFLAQGGAAAKENRGPRVFLSLQ